jgi:hypothetical protein
MEMEISKTMVVLSEREIENLAWALKFLQDYEKKRGIPRPQDASVSH